MIGRSERSFLPEVDLTFSLVLFSECQNDRGEFSGLGTKPYKAQVLHSVSKFKESKETSQPKDR